MSHLHKFAVVIAYTSILLGSVHGQVRSNDQPFLHKVPAPERGDLYHGIHIGGRLGEENLITRKATCATDPQKEECRKDLIQEEYLDVVKPGKNPFFIYFSQEWGEEGQNKAEFRRFPITTINDITRKGAIPFIRLMLRSSSKSLENCEIIACREQYFSLENIVGWNERELPGIDVRRRNIHTEIESDLRLWGEAARSYPGPLIIEFGTEVNNKSFHWNAKHNLEDRVKAAALFRKTFRYIAEKIGGSNPEASNITWVFHVTAENDPADDWNSMESYFPDGTPEDPRNFVDWVGISIYGSTDRTTCTSFRTQFDLALHTNGLLRLSKLRKDRPLFILEFGAASNYPGDIQANCKGSRWTSEAIGTMLTSASAGELSGFSWWSENFKDDDDNKTLKMRVRDFTNELKRIYLGFLAGPHVVHARSLR